MTRRHLVALITALLATTTVAALAPAATAATHRRAAASYRLNPRHNIRPPQTVYGAACRNHPRGATCTAIMLKALNHAHAVMGQPKYAVPARFAALEPQEQLLVLSNLDRRLYKRTPITGLNGRLNGSARAGARQDRDPYPVAKVNGASWYAASSNWAGGTAPMSTPLFAYYEWMFDDGPGSNNLDCQHAGDPGCWGHRDDTLMSTPAGTQLEMGVGRAKPSGTYSWTELYEAFDRKAVIPCIPTVTGLSRHQAPLAGGRLTVRGLGFVQVRTVRVLGAQARIVKRSTTSLTVVAPKHAAGSGFLVVATSGGTSSRTRAAAFRYAR